MKKTIVKRFLPVLILLTLWLYMYITNMHHPYLTFESLKVHHAFLTAYVQDHWYVAALLFMLLYIGIVTLSIPGAFIMTMAGGFLFGSFFGTCFSVIAATIGATIVFLITRRLSPDLSKMKSWIKKMEAGFKKDAFNYLLVLRLIPLFPFSAVNLIPGFLGMPLRPFVLATFFGIIPGAFVYTSVGTGLGSILEKDQSFSVKGIFTPDIMIALGGLAILALLPVIYRHLKHLKILKIP